MRKTRFTCLTTIALLAACLGFGLSEASHAAGPKTKPQVLISGVYIHGYLDGVPNADSAVRLINLDQANPADLSDYALSDQYTPRTKRKSSSRKAKMGDDIDIFGDDSDIFDDDFSLFDDDKPKRRRGRPEKNRVVRLPKGAVIPPGGEIWVAASAKGFRQIFGHNPAFEALDTDPAVPDLDPDKGFIWLVEGYGTVALLDRSDHPVDFVAFQGHRKRSPFSDDAFDDVPWKGGPVMLREGSIYAWQGRVLNRAKDELGRVLPDTDSARDWPVGFATTPLGQYPTHRVELAGQSNFIAKPIRVRAKAWATSAPDNNYQTLIEAFDAAKKELRVRVYEFTNPKIAEALIATKKRGVDVELFLEGSPVGGISDQGRWIADRISKAGIPVHFLATPKGSKLKPRYRFDHSKYVIVDDRRVVIGTENYGRTGVPVYNSYGNRGWMIHIENRQFAAQLRAVWDHDYRPGELGDLIAIDDSDSDSYGLPYRDPGFEPSDKLPQGSYRNPVKPAVVEDVMGLELVLSPDTSLNEGSAIIGMIARAKESLYLEQNSVLPFWAPKPSKNKDAEQAADAERPIASLPLQAVVAAARRGVKVRVLLDGTWYNAEATDERDNDDTVRYLNELADKERLDMRAKLINLETTHLDKIHSKGVIVDEREVYVGSINWTENSFAGNREVGVIVSHPKIAGYYSKLFARDWSQSRLYASTLLRACKVKAEPRGKSRTIATKKAGTRIDIVDERSPRRHQGAWVEVALGLGRTGFCPMGLLGIPEVTPVETRYVIGRDAVVTGKVVEVYASSKVTKLKFQDPDRAPFMAVIFQGDAQKFVDQGMPPKTAFEGKTVRLEGRVKVYRIPEIILNRPDQIEILQ